MTLFNYNGESIYGTAQYVPTLIKQVYLEMKNASDGGNEHIPSSSALLYLPLRIADTAGKSYTAPKAWREAAVKTGIFTLSPEGDMIYPGDAGNASSPPDGSLKVTGVRIYDAMLGSMKHCRISLCG